MSQVIATGGDSVFDITDGGVNYRVHVFSTVGTSSFVVSQGGEVEYLVVAGGGGGGTGRGGGGGAGGLLTGATTVSAGTASVVVGAGGAGGAASNAGLPGANGSTSSAFSVSTVGGGGGGGGSNGLSGGSGGGAGTGLFATFGAGTSGQGNDGGDTVGTSNSAGAGGGGAGTVGGNAATLGGGGAGGDGLTSTITGTSVAYAGGGGGGTQGGTAGAGGLGGGGAGSVSDAAPQNGTDGLGGGGGGAGRASGNSPPAGPGGNGGSGVVIIRYILFPGPFAPDPTVTIDGVDYTGDTIGAVRVTRGRDTVYSEPQPGYATIRLIDKTGQGIPVAVGTAVAVDLEPGRPVFRGTITDWTAELYDPGIGSTPAATVSITAVGPMLRLNRRLVFSGGRTAELEADRILAAIEDGLALTWEEASGAWDDFDGAWEDALEQPFDPALIDPGIFTLGDLDPQDAGYNALTVIQQSAASGAGIAYETADGFIAFANADRRPANRAAGPYDVPSTVVVAQLNTYSQLADISNKVAVTYASGVETAQDDVSISQYGSWERQVDTNLANQSNALARANDYINRHGQPSVQFGQVAIRVDGLGVTLAGQLLDLDINDAVDIPIPRTLLPTNTVGFVEQVVYRFDAFRAEIVLTVSDYRLSEAAERWGQVEPSIIWDDVLITWSQATTVYAGIPPLVPDNPFRPPPAP
jgi:hypothetical protein